MIKPEADAIFFVMYPEQRNLALALEECFDVTRGERINQLYFWLLEPHENIRERFGLQQEVLAIYSEFPKTDDRASAAIYQIKNSSKFKYRLDRMLVLLIHRGAKQEVEALVQREKDFVILPFHIDELLNHARGDLFIRSKISGAIGSIDLFGMSSPLTSEKYFFGRNELVQSLIARSVHATESSGLFGLRKTGKTSVLYAVQRRLADSPTIVEYLDCQSPGTHNLRWWELLERLTARCREAVKRERMRDVRIRGDYSQRNAASRFSDDLRQLLEDGHLEHIVIMFDEIEFITAGLAGALGQHWDNDFFPFWQTIRAVKQETQGRLSFILAGVNPASVERSTLLGQVNPIFQLAVPHYLSPLSVESVRDMVRTIGRYSGLRMGEQVYPYLAKRFGGHPYLIRIACSEVWKGADTSDPEELADVSVQDFLDKREEIKLRLAEPIRDILLSLVWWYPDEYDLLRIIAAGDASFVGYWVEEKPVSIAQFINQGLLRDRSGDFAIDDLRDFLNDNGEAYKAEISPFVRGDMPPDLLPAVPDRDALGKLFVRRTELEIKLRRAILMYLGVKHGWKPEKIAAAMSSSLPVRKDRPKPEQLFVGRRPNEVINELYTSDLKAIVSENWDVFAPLFDHNRSRFEMNMDSMNMARRVDGHTKPFSKAELDEFENSYAWLQSRLGRIPPAEPN